MPAVSADGRWIAFWTRGAIVKAPLGGSPIMDIMADLQSAPWGLAWDADGCLFFGREAAGISQIAGGGQPKAVTTLREGET